MNILLATQGSQGIIAIRELFALGLRNDQLKIVICSVSGNEPLIKFIEYLKLSFVIIKSSSEFDNYLQSIMNKNQLLISVSWKYRFSEFALDAFKGNAINFHPGILPDYKGCFSIPWAIINGENTTGYTFHKIELDFDSGPLIIQEKLHINNKDTAFSMHFKIMQKGLSNIGLAIENFKKNKFTKMNSQGNYYKNELPFDGKINSSWDKNMRDRFIRAMYFPPHKSATEVIDGIEYEVLPDF